MDTARKVFYTVWLIILHLAVPPSMDRDTVTSMSSVMVETYTVKPGDTLSSIGESTGFNWYEIYEKNRFTITNPHQIKVGWVLQLPPDRHHSSGISTSINDVVVSPGQSLSEIASIMGINWRELYEVNRHIIGDNPNNIHPGMILRLP